MRANIYFSLLASIKVFTIK
jgi:hypothetical protein